jgi:hypothetical protein
MHYSKPCIRSPSLPCVFLIFLCDSVVNALLSSARYSPTLTGTVRGLTAAILGSVTLSTPWV